MQIADEYWDAQLQRWPTWATHIGDRRFEGALERLDDTSRVATRERFEATRRRLGELDRSQLSESDLVTADVLLVEVERELGEDDHLFWQWNVDQMYGPQVWFLSLGTYHPMDAAGRATYLERLRRFPAYIDEYIGTLRAGLANGNTAPRIATERVVAQLETIVAKEPADSALVVDAERLPEEERDAVSTAFDAEVSVIVRDEVLPAYATLLAFLRGDYLPHARDAIGLGHDEHGQAAYRHRIWYHTSLRMEADEVHQIGLDTLEHLQKRMRTIAVRMGHEGDLASFNAALRKDPSNFYASRADVEADAQRILDRATAALPELVNRLPKAKCVVTRLEPFREKDAPAAYYDQPAVDGSRPGTFFINTYKPESRMRCNMPALALHEAVPGHHLQLALAQEMPDVPEFRRHVGVTSYVEGWALYSELLGEETGLYEDDLAIYGMLTYQSWRAARLVVDTGMHAKGWARERAVRFFRDNVAISEQEIQNEIDRYITWPGQALAYMIGCLEIKALRARAEDELGQRFDLREFHDEVLRHGAIPLSVLRRVIDRWIRNRAESA